MFEPAFHLTAMPPVMAPVGKYRTARENTNHGNLWPSPW